MENIVRYAKYHSIRNSVDSSLRSLRSDGHFRRALDRVIDQAVSGSAQVIRACISSTLSANANYFTGLLWLADCFPFIFRLVIAIKFVATWSASEEKSFTRAYRNARLRSGLLPDS